jgi:hypothetical protein
VYSARDRRDQALAPLGIVLALIGRSGEWVRMRLDTMSFHLPPPVPTSIPYRSLSFVTMTVGGSVKFQTTSEHGTADGTAHACGIAPIDAPSGLTRGK